MVMECLCLLNSPVEDGVPPEIGGACKSESRGCDTLKRSRTTPWKTIVDPEHHWLVEENHLSMGPLSGSMLVFGSVN